MTTVDLSGQVALVTGASRGIGRAIAQELAKLGAKVIGTATSESGASAISEYLGNGGKGVVLDVNDAARSVELIDEIQKEFGAVSILVNNAAVSYTHLTLPTICSV